MQKDKFQEREIVNNYELAGIVIIFLIVLAVLFPKNQLKSYILEEKSNYNLAKSYLQALIKAYPQNSDFVKYLIEFDLKLYDINDAYKVGKKYLNRFKNDLQFQLLFYRVLKQLYFQTKNKKYKNEAKEVLLGLLDKKADFVLKEAKSFGFLDLAFLAYKRLKIYNNEFLNLALYFKDYKLAEDILKRLYLRDKSLNILIKSAEVETILKHYKKASELYLQVYKKTGDIRYFKKAFYILVWNKKYSDALKLAKSYEDFFLKRKNFKILEEFLKFYLAINRLKEARRLSLKIKKELKI